MASGFLPRRYTTHERHTHQFGKAAGFHLGHDVGAIDLDRAVTDREIQGDDLCWPCPRRKPVQNLPLPLGERPEPGSDLARLRRFARRPVWPRSSALRTDESSLSSSKGLLRRSRARPPFIASTASGTYGVAGEMMITGTLQPFALSRRRSAMPSVPGMRMSEITQAGRNRGRLAQEGVGGSRRRARRAPRGGPRRKHRDSRTPRSSSITCTMASFDMSEVLLVDRAQGESGRSCPARARCPRKSCRRATRRSCGRSRGPRPCRRSLVADERLETVAPRSPARCRGPVSATPISTRPASGSAARGDDELAAGAVGHRLDGVADQVEQHPCWTWDTVERTAKLGLRIEAVGDAPRPSRGAPTSASAHASSTSLWAGSRICRSALAAGDETRAGGGSPGPRATLGSPLPPRRPNSIATCGPSILSRMAPAALR